MGHQCATAAQDPLQSTPVPQTPASLSTADSGEAKLAVLHRDWGRPIRDRRSCTAPAWIGGALRNDLAFDVAELLQEASDPHLPRSEPRAGNAGHLRGDPASRHLLALSWEHPLPRLVDLRDSSHPYPVVRESAGRSCHRPISEAELETLESRRPSGR